MAHFNPFCDAYFVNSMPGASGGKVIVWDTLRIAPATVRMPQGTVFHAIAQDTSINSISYTFTHWSDGPTSRDRQDTANQHGSFTAEFAAKPFSPTSFQQTASVGQNVTLTWTNNSNTAVDSCRIYRHRAGYSRTLVARLGRVTQWIDPDILVADPKEGPEYIYDLCSVFQQVESDYVTVNQFGQEYSIRPIGGLKGLNLDELPRQFAVGSYPNPFNPSTTIAYQVICDADVRLEIFDIAGKKIRSLVDGAKQPGYYSVVWNSKNQSGQDVASGVYFYHFIANPSDGTQAFKQSGKLVLTR